MGSTSKDRAVKAMAAMSEMGFPRAKTKFILKQLLKTCENNWNYIEAENYRLLVEAIIESEEPEVDDQEKKNGDDSLHSKKKEAPPPEEPERYIKKLRARKEEWVALTSAQDAGMSSRSFSPKNYVAQQSNPGERSRQSTRRGSVSPDTSLGQGGVGPLALYEDRRGKRVTTAQQESVSDSGKPKEHSHLICRKKLRFDHGPGSASENAMACNEDLEIEPCLDPVSGGAGPVDEDVQIIGDSVSFEVPLAVVHPTLPWRTITEGTMFFPTSMSGG